MHYLILLYLADDDPEKRRSGLIFLYFLKNIGTIGGIHPQLHSAESPTNICCLLFMHIPFWRSGDVFRNSMILPEGDVLTRRLLFQSVAIISFDEENACH